MEEPLMTPDDVARRLRVSRRTVYRWTSLGLLRAIRAGQLLRFDSRDVAEFLQGDRRAQ